MKNWSQSFLASQLKAAPLRDYLINFGLVALFFAVMVVTKISALTSDFELDTDEGFNIIKAWLYSRGFPLYGQMWNDQPPLYTILLTGWMQLWGWSLPVARTLTLGFSALLVWCFYQITWRSLGIVPALIGALLLSTSWGFSQLSVSAMIGLPALALAMLSIYWLLLYEASNALPWLIASGMVLGCSLQTKLFTAFLVPIILAYIGCLRFRSTRRFDWKSIFLPLFIWLMSGCLIYLVIGLTSGQLLHLSSTFTSHLKQSTPADELLSANFNSFAYFRSMLAQDRRYLLPFAFGAAFLIFRKRQWVGLLPIFWLLASTAVILKHKPLWYHHYLLFSIPFYWLLSYAIAFFLDFLRQQSNIQGQLTTLKARMIALGVGLLLLIIGIGKTMPPLPIKPPTGDAEALNQILRYKPVTNWIFTDRPIYAFKAGLTVPPETAVISIKRFNSGNLTLADLLAVWQRYQPEQILLARWTDKIQQDQALSAYLKTNYAKTYTNPKTKLEHYVRKGLWQIDGSNAPPISK